MNPGDSFTGPLKLFRAGWHRRTRLLMIERLERSEAMAQAWIENQEASVTEAERMLASGGMRYLLRSSVMARSSMLSMLRMVERNEARLDELRSQREHLRSQRAGTSLNSEEELEFKRVDELLRPLNLLKLFLTRDRREQFSFVLDDLRRDLIDLRSGGAHDTLTRALVFWKFALEVAGSLLQATKELLSLVSALWGKG